MNYFLGVDAGATKTKAVIIDEHSNILGEAEGGPANYHNIGIVEATTNVVATIGQLLEKTKLTPDALSWVTIGIAACDTQKDYDLLLSKFTTGPMQPVAEKITVINDAKIGLYSGTLPPGIVVVCGTGSNVYGKNSQGIGAMAGNWGHFLGDKGSGYNLGQRMFQAVVAAYDGTGEETKLRSRLEKRLNITSPRDILDWYNDTQPSVHLISDFAPTVLECAEEGDEVSKELVEKTITELGKALSEVIKKLKMENEAIRIVTCGGLFESKYFRALFEGHVTALIKHARIIKPLVTQAVGAAIMAMHTWEKTQNVHSS